VTTVTQDTSLPSSAFLDSNSRCAPVFNTRCAPVFNLDSLAQQIQTLLLARNPKLSKLLTSDAKQHILNDSRYPLQFLSAALHFQEPLIFSNYVTWAGETLASRNVTRKQLQEHLSLILEVLHSNYSLPELDSYFQLALTTLDSVTVTPSFLLESNPYSSLTHDYLQALLNNNKEVAVDLILDSAASSTPIPDIYTHVFTNVQKEVGRLWQANHLSVAQEHYYSAVTQLAISQLYPYVRAQFKANRKPDFLISACVGSELHEIGLRLVSDSLECQGWKTIFLGASQPLSGLLETITSLKAKVILLSTSLAFHLPILQQTIQHLKTNSDVKVLIGGSSLSINNLWTKFGADAFAPDIPSAVLETARLLKD